MPWSSGRLLPITSRKAGLRAVAASQSGVEITLWIIVAAAVLAVLAVDPLVFEPLDGNRIGAQIPFTGVIPEPAHWASSARTNEYSWN